MPKGQTESKIQKYGNNCKSCNYCIILNAQRIQSTITTFPNDQCTKSNANGNRQEQQGVSHFNGQEKHITDKNKYTFCESVHGSQRPIQGIVNMKIVRNKYSFITSKMEANKSEMEANKRFITL